jgi:hypothetical protein
MSEEKARQVRPWDLFNKNKSRSTEDIQKARLAICETCPFFISLTRQCKKCGCFMDAKTKLAEAYCPEDKWGSEDMTNIAFKESDEE